MALDLRQCDLVDPPYLNIQMSDSSYLEEDTQYPQVLLEAVHISYRYMANNGQDAKVKYPIQFYVKYLCSLKYHFVMAESIFSIAPTPVESERDFSIAGVFSRVRNRD